MLYRFLSYFILVTAAAAAAKSLQSCPTLCDPINSSPPGSPIPGILQARILEWVAISFSNAWKWKVKVKSLSCVRLLATSTAAYQAPLSMRFSRQEYWGGLPLPSPERERSLLIPKPSIFFLCWVWAIYFTSQSLITSLIPKMGKMHPTKEEYLRIK